MKKVVIILSVTVLILAIVIVYLTFSKGLITLKPNITPQPTVTSLNDRKDNTIGNETRNNSEIKADGIKMGNIKSGVIEASNFKFTPDAIAVLEGDTVTITFKNNEGIHDFTIDEFKVKSKTIQAGTTEEVTFVASKKGTFKFYCSVGQHRAMGMEGTLVVQ